MSRLVWSAAVGAAAVTAHVAVNLRLLRRPPADGPVTGAPVIDAAAVSVLVPARNEADRIRPCVRSLLASTGIDVELLVLDDGSTDGTAGAVREVAAGDPRVRVLAGAPLPAGWLGKPHACAQLAAAARGQTLVFVDADVRVAPGGLAATVGLLAAHDLDLVCPYPRQLADGAGPRLVQPLLQWSWLAFLPLRLAERGASPSLVAANGQVLACRAAAYRAAGGHAAVRDRVLEDLELAREFKRAGYRATVADGTHVATCRMYADWPALVEGYTKSLWVAFGSPRGAAAAVGLLAWLYLLPPAAAVVGLARGRRPLAVAGLTGYAAAVAGRVMAARRTGGRAADALAHPASVAALTGLTATSVRRHAAGRLTWKGRPL
ncbi:MAG: glycosyltransferase family 2 protein [Egibacteraceae bacterium]